MSESSDKIAILLCSLNGERFLVEQLDSIAAQTCRNWQLWVSDDGSSDRTLQILDRYRLQLGEEKLSCLAGPQRGFAANFLSLACNSAIEAEYFAFSDHDDIWEPDKLERALAWLQSQPESMPALYCSRTRLIDGNGRAIGFSPLFTRPPTFTNALVQSIGGGNTMVFNRAARSLLQKAGDQVDVVTHDWWSYLVVSGCGGRVFYDPCPGVRYRQHGTNLVGSNIGWRARIARVAMLFKGRFQEWNTRNCDALEAISHLLTIENRAILIDWTRVRHDSLAARLIGLKRAGLYRQTAVGNLGLLAAAIFRRI